MIHNPPKARPQIRPHQAEHRGNDSGPQTSPSLLLVPGFQLFGCVPQEDVIFLLRIIKFMALGPVVAGSVGKYVSVVIEAAGRYGLI